MHRHVGERGRNEAARRHQQQQLHRAGERPRQHFALEKREIRPPAVGAAAQRHEFAALG
jgi:hypothetical protein